MSTEVECNEYLHTMEQQKISRANDDDREARLKEILDRRRRRLGSDNELPTSAAMATKTTSTPVAVWKHNPLHDLESVFWLALYLLFVGKLVSDGERVPEMLEEYTRRHNALAVKLFNDEKFRLVVMQSSTAFQNHLVSLHPGVDAIARHLDHMRSCLVTTFQTAEKDLQGKTISYLDALDLYKEFDADLDKITDLLEGTGKDINIAIDEESCEKLRRALPPGDPARAEDDKDDAAANGTEGRAEEGTTAPDAKRPRTEGSYGGPSQAQVLQLSSSDRLEMNPMSAPATIPQRR